MKKVVFIYTGSSEFGGLARYLKLLFKNVDKTKVDIRLISLGEWPVSKKIETIGGHVVYLPKTRLSLGTIYKITSYLKKENINLVVTAGLLSDFYGRKAGILSGTPVLTTVHSDPGFDYPGIFKKVIFFTFDRPLRGVTKKYVAVSEAVAQSLVKRGIKREKVEVVYNGVNFVERSKGEHDGVVLGSVGRLHKTKGFDVLLEALRELPAEVSLKIWGEGQERESLGQQIAEMGLSDRVFLMGLTQDIAVAFSSIDIYVQSSRMEGFGLTVAEAMGAGLPVVVTPVGSLPEVVKDNKTGLVAKELSPKALAAEVKKLINDPKLAKKLGEEAAEDVRKRFSIERWITEMTRIFLEVAK